MPPLASSTVPSTPTSTVRPTRCDTDGTFVYVGRLFNTVGGVSARKVAKLTAAGQLVTTGGGASLLPAPNGAVNEVVVRGSRLYIGGSFTTVGGAGTPRIRLAALNTSTGAVLPEVNVPFDGVYDPALGGTTNIKRMDISPDGSRLVAVGNFSAVGGQTRSQIAMINLPATGNASVSPWATDRFDAAHNNCAGVFQTFMRDVDFAPNGAWFAVTTTGAFAGGAASGTMCDTSSRWSATSTTGVQQPVWVNYTGGDTTYGVAVTGSAVYVGGHMRWQNNPFQGDQAGPVPFPARASPRSIRSTACPCPGTRAGPAESAPKLSTRRREDSGSEATPTVSAERHTDGSR